MKKRYVADFETATHLDDITYVWAYAVCEIGQTNLIMTGNNIDDFMEYCERLHNAVIYFHNLKFDGHFIFSWLLENGYEYIKDKKEKKDKTFTTLISKIGQYYSIEVYFKVGKYNTIKVTFNDSYKIIPFSVKETAKSFKLPFQKLKMNHNIVRERNHILTEEERQYLYNDVRVMSLALYEIFKDGIIKITQGSIALTDYKQIMEKDYEYLFPILDNIVDTDIRKTYKGGFTYLNPIYEEVDVYNGNVFDVNSLYPSVMVDFKQPFGEPIFFTGKYENDLVYDLYVQQFTCSFEIKENKIPTIQIKGSYFNDTEYLTTSNGELITLTLTCIDLELFFEHYYVYDLTFESGWKFKSKKGMFDEYIYKWINKKIEASKNKNGGQRQIAKLRLNSLYGKFALNPEIQSRFPFLDGDGIVRLGIHEKEYRDPIYIPVGSFITSYARNKTIRTSQKIKEYSIEKYGKDLYIYSDTDSIHTLLPLEDCKKLFEIDDYELGKWAHEAHFTKARFVRQKCYIEEFEISQEDYLKILIDKEDDEDNNKIIYEKDYKFYELKVTSAGLPQNCYKYVNWDNFRTHFSCKGKLKYTPVKGRSSFKRRRISYS